MLTCGVSCPSAGVSTGVRGTPLGTPAETRAEALRETRLVIGDTDRSRRVRVRTAGDVDSGALHPGDETYLQLHVSALKPRKA
jgi:hypothetical protein